MAQILERRSITDIFKYRSLLLCKRGLVKIQIEKTKLAVASLDKIKEIFDKVGIVVKEIDGSKKEYLFKSEEALSEKTIALCEGCGTTISLDNFGHLAKGSKLLYCKNPLCFTHYIANNKLR